MCIIIWTNNHSFCMVTAQRIYKPYTNGYDNCDHRSSPFILVKQYTCILIHLIHSWFHVCVGLGFHDIKQVINYLRENIFICKRKRKQVIIQFYSFHSFSIILKISKGNQKPHFEEGQTNVMTKRKSTKRQIHYTEN
jgi:hypothetical protein